MSAKAAAAAIVAVFGLGIGTERTACGDHTVDYGEYVRIVGSAPAGPNIARDVALDGDIAFVTNEGGLLVFDIVDRANPMNIGFIPGSSRGNASPSATRPSASASTMSPTPPRPRFSVTFRSPAACIE
jgi:hypothetical protein